MHAPRENNCPTFLSSVVASCASPAMPGMIGIGATSIINMLGTAYLCTIVVKHDEPSLHELPDHTAKDILSPAFTYLATHWFASCRNWPSMQSPQRLS